MMKRIQHFKQVPFCLFTIIGLTLDLPARASDLNALTLPLDGRSRRVSSHDPDWENGNRDWREIEPGQTLILAEIDGPGVIRHMWFTVNAYDKHYPRSLVIRMYWDGHEAPSVEAPFGDFFAVGHGLRRYVDSVPVSVVSEGRAYSCFWAMPFHQSARITITNDHPRARVPKFYYYIDYDETPSLPKDTMLFHAQYRQEYPGQPGDYLICRTQGRGHYVGTVLSVQLRAKGWFGEGDDRFYIDGEEKPSLHGTGTEDYFSDAWGFREMMRPYYGVVLMEGFEFGDRVCVYRWHIHDPIRFNKSLRFAIEDKGTLVNKEGKPFSGHGERSDLFSSVAYWYQQGHAERFAEVPPLEERVPAPTKIELEASLDQAELIEGKGEFAVIGGGVFSGGKCLLVKDAEEGTVIRVPFIVEDTLTGAGRLALHRSISAGVWRAWLDGEVVERLRHADLYHGEYGPADFNLGYVELEPGRHELKFECLGKSDAARDTVLGIDVLEVEPVTYHYSEQ